MSKKIFDIIPPEKVEENPPEKIFQVEKPVKKKKFFKWAVILFSLFLVLAITGSLLFPSASLSIKPETSILEVRQEIILDLGSQIADFNSKTIPAKLFKDENSLEKEFSSTGKAAAEKKATGKITVYNEYSTSSRTLIPSRFVSADGKLFWSTEKITIPGYKKENGKIVPGQAEVTIEASEPGEEYNIEATSFALPALAGSPLYTTVYARSFSAMTGGAIGEVAQVSKDDLEMAEQSLADDIKKQSLESLRKNLPEKYILLEETISQDIMETSGSVEIGDLVDSFKLEADVKSSGFAFRKDDLDRFVDELIKLNLEKEDNFLKESLSLNYDLKSVNLDSGQLILEVTIQVKTYKEINEIDLKKALLGQELKEAEMLLGGLEEISSFEIRNRPFFKKKLPEQIEKLQVILVLD